MLIKPNLSLFFDSFPSMQFMLCYLNYKNEVEGSVKGFRDQQQVESKTKGPSFSVQLHKKKTLLLMRRFILGQF